LTVFGLAELRIGFGMLNTGQPLTCINVGTACPPPRAP